MPKSQPPAYPPIIWTRLQNIRPLLMKAHLTSFYCFTKSEHPECQRWLLVRCVGGNGGATPLPPSRPGPPQRSLPPHLSSTAGVPGIKIPWPAIPTVQVWLMRHGRERQARDVLQWLRGPDYCVEAEMKELEAVVAEELAARQQGSTSCAAPLTDRSFLTPLAIVCCLFAFQVK